MLVTPPVKQYEAMKIEQAAAEQAFIASIPPQLHHQQQLARQQVKQRNALPFSRALGLRKGFLVPARVLAAGRPAMRAYTFVTHFINKIK